MIEDAPHDLLRDVTVDQPGAEGVAPLVRGQPDRAAVRVANLAAGQPAIEREPVGRRGSRGPAVGVLGRAREQHRGVPDAALLFSDQSVKLLVDRDQRLTLHLVVEIAQVGGAVGVEDHAVPRHAQRVGDPQPGPDQDQRDQPVGRVGEPGEIARVLDLGHHLLGQRAGRPLDASGIVLAEHQRVRGQGVVPVVLADRVQERVELPDLVAVALAAGELGVQVGQVALQHRPVNLGERADADACAEQREPGQGAQPPSGRFQPESGPEPPAQPPLHQAAQPRLPDRGEVELLVAGEPEAAQLPDVAVELALPPVAVGEIGHLAAGVDQQCAQVGVARRRAADPGPPVVLGPVQQRHRASGGQRPHRRHDHRGEGLGGPLVVTALQHVLDLQTQLRAQQVQPDDLLLGGRDLLEAADEDLDLGSPVDLPGVDVGVAER
jgi:hypothetical protein